jgi:acetolactate synthase-1/2/3 large subunit
MITGEPQVVMVHVIVGTGNASAAVMNASRLNVPMIFSAGRTPLTEEGLTGSRSNFIHWGQESFDQGVYCVNLPLGLSCAMASKSKRWSTARWK